MTRPTKGRKAKAGNALPPKPQEQSKHRSAGGHRPFSPERAKEEAALEKARSGDSHNETPDDTKIDEAVADSFPASDPPSSNAGRDRNS